MNRDLRAPEDRYAVTVDVLYSPDGTAFMRQQTATGVPRQWPDAGRPEFLVVVGEACELVLELGEQELTVRSIRLRRASRAIITLLIAGCDDDDGPRPEARVQIFDGDRAAARGYRERSISVGGVAPVETPAPQAAPAGTPLERLALAVGRSVARANAALARLNAEAGVALVSSVTIRVGVEQAEVDGGRVTLSLARPGQEGGQFVEFTMTTVPGAEAAGPGEEAPTPGAGVDDGTGVIRVPSRGTSRPRA